MVQCVRMTNASLYYVIWKEGKHYVSQCLNVDVSSFGATREQAVGSLNKALALYFEDEKTVQNEMIEAPEIGSVSLHHA